MIFVYSIREKILQSADVQLTDQVNRQSQHYTIHIAQQYMDIFGPMAPFGLQYPVVIDKNTNTEIPKKDWTPQLKEKTAQLKSETPFAWGLFRNIFIIAGVFLVLALVMPHINKRNADQAAATASQDEAGYQSIAPGDLLKVQLLSGASGSNTLGNVSLMKVVRINGDSLVVRRHLTGAEGFNVADTDKLDRNDQNFEKTEEVFMLSRFKKGVERTLIPFNAADGSSSAATASVRGIEKAG